MSQDRPNLLYIHSDQHNPAVKLAATAILSCRLPTWITSLQRESSSTTATALRLFVYPPECPCFPVVTLTKTTSGRTVIF